MTQGGPLDPDSVDDAMGQHHEHLGLLLGNLGSAIQAASPDALEALKILSRELLKHMKWEEEALFPAVRNLSTPAQQRSIESLEIDHERLRDTLSTLDSTLHDRDFRTARSLADWLATLLKGHNYDEEHGVYVEADRLLDIAERRRLIKTFRMSSGEGTP